MIARRDFSALLLLGVFTCFRAEAPVLAGDNGFAGLDNFLLGKDAKMVVLLFHSAIKSRLVASGSKDFALATARDSLQEAIEKSRVAAQKSPADSKLRASYALALLLGEQIEAANLEAASAFAKDNKNARALAVLAMCDHYRERADAGKHMAEAIELNRSVGDADVCILAAEFFTRLGKFEQAHRCVRQWVKLEPGNGHAFDLKAQLELKMGDAEAALGDLDTAIRLNPKDLNPYYTRGKLHQSHRNYRQAALDFESFAKYGGGGPAMLGRRGDCYAHIGQSVKAIDDYTKAINLLKQWKRSSNALNGTELAGDLTRFVVSRAEMYEKRGDVRQAQADARWLLARQPDSVPGLDLMQRTSRTLGDYPAALDALTRLVSIDNDVPEWFRMRAEVFKKMGRSTNAENDLKSAELIDKQGRL